MLLAPWPGFPAGECGLEQRRPPVPQPLHQPRVQLRSTVTALGGDSLGGRGGEGLPWLVWTKLQVPPLSVPWTGHLEGKGLWGHLCPAMSPLPRLDTRDWGHNLVCPALLMEAEWGQGWGPRAEATGSELILACRHPWAPPLPELPPATQPDQWNSELYCRQSEHRLKSVEWSSLPLVGTSSSGGADSESSSCLLAARYHVQKVTGDPLQAPGHIAEQKGAQSLCGDSRATWEGGVGGAPLVSPPPTPAGL